MITTHFFKSLVIFALMIALGLAGVLFVSYLDQKEDTQILENAEVPN